MLASEYFLSCFSEENYGINININRLVAVSCSLAQVPCLKSPNISYCPAHSVALSCLKKTIIVKYISRMA